MTEPKCDEEIAKDICTDVRFHWRCTLEDQTHAKRRQESKAVDRCVGQAKYVFAREIVQAWRIHWRWAPANRFESTVMDRDRRLTGFLRGQTDNVNAPAGFELSNPWRVSPELFEAAHMLDLWLTFCSLKERSRERVISRQFKAMVLF